MIRQFLLISGMLVMIFGLKAQDPIFSQYYAAPLQINPAFAGNAYAPNFALNYRNQWPSLKAYVTYSASYDQFVPHLNSGFGLLLLTDDAGDGLIRTNKVAGSFGYRLQLNRNWFIKLGAEIAGVQTKYNWDQFIFFDQIDEKLGPFSQGGVPFPTEEQPPEDPNNFYFDASAGMMIYNRVFYAGFAIKHLNTPEEAILGINNNISGGLPRRITFHTGAEIQIIKGNKRRPSAFISPNLLYVRQGDFGQVNVGAYAQYGVFFLGGWFRHAQSNSDAVIALVGVEQGIFKIGYSYDLTISGLAGFSGGSHEISFRIRLQEPEEDINDCLKLFR
ncbi:MAG: PorP/SprF family type IX secretion system membrane protein [Bacteroidota bacterium]